MSATDLLEELWRQQSCWSHAAGRMKKGIERARASALVLAVAVAVLSTATGALAGPRPDMSRAFAALAAFGVALLPVLRPAWSGTALRNWTRARSVSEALKSEVYLWLARAGDYRDDTDATVLRTKTDKINSDGDDLLRYRTGFESEDRALPEVHDLPSYFTVRVGGQIDGYYLPRSRRLERRLRWFKRLELALALTGIALGAATATLGATLAPWIAVVTTVGTSIAVHVAAGRYEYQLIEFLRTARRLTQLKEQARGAGPDELDALAVSAEAVISVENQGWMAKVVEDPPNHTSPTGR